MAIVVLASVTCVLLLLRESVGVVASVDFGSKRGAVAFMGG
jgi:hypothetical protein